MCDKDTTADQSLAVKCVKCDFSVHEDCELDKAAYDKPDYNCPNCRVHSFDSYSFKGLSRCVYIPNFI